MHEQAATVRYTTARAEAKASGKLTMPAESSSGVTGWAAITSSVPVSCSCRAALATDAVVAESTAAITRPTAAKAK